MDRLQQLRAFGTHRVGRTLLVALSILTLAGTLFYLGPLFAMFVFLLFGLALPIYLGWRIPRQLALAGVVALLLGAPVFSAAYAYELRQPSPWANSNPTAPDGHGGSVLQHAHVTPFTGTAGGNYTFTVDVEPQYLPVNTSAAYLLLFISDCPYATTNHSSACPASYRFYELNHSLGSPITATQTIPFFHNLPGADAWWWTMALVLHRANSTNLSWVWLYTSMGYSGVQGPISGDFFSTFELILPVAYELSLLYPGLLFFVGLLIYVLLKNRERVRKAAKDLPGPGSLGTLAAPPKVSSPDVKGPVERSCPNCQAVVYPNETKCWKCGSELKSESAPIPSTPATPTP
ncbi:MAG: hypothetical protein L3J93_05685 [Thermoplasmata archaeon]|nr:hypothetical protein [Thermoplasmata archaeon]